MTPGNQLLKWNRVKNKFHHFTMSKSLAASAAAASASISAFLAFNASTDSLEEEQDASWVMASARDASQVAISWTSEESMCRKGLDNMMWCSVM